MDENEKLRILNKNSDHLIHLYSSEQNQAKQVRWVAKTVKFSACLIKGYDRNTIKNLRTNVSSWKSRPRLFVHSSPKINL